MINFHYLRIFYYVAKNLSFTLAARDLFITQPAVTKQVKILEDNLNLRLFDKDGQKVILTEEGKALFEYAEHVFEYEKEIELAVEEIKSLKRGVLSISTPKPLSGLMSFLMNVFHKNYPDVRIQVKEGSSLAITHSLLKGETDIGLIAGVLQNPDIRFIHFAREPMLFIVSPDHPLAKAKSVSLSELSTQPIIVRGPGSGSRKTVVDAFEENGYKPNILLETDNMEYTKQHLQEEMVGAFLAEPYIREELREEKLVKIPIRGHKIFLDIYVAFLKNRSLPLPAKEFMRLLMKLEPGTKHFPYLVPDWPRNCPSLDDL